MCNLRKNTRPTSRGRTVVRTYNMYSVKCLHVFLKSMDQQSDVAASMVTGGGQL